MRTPLEGNEKWAFVMERNQRLNQLVFNSQQNEAMRFYLGLMVLHAMQVVSKVSNLEILHKDQVNVYQIGNMQLIEDIQKGQLILTGDDTQIGRVWYLLKGQQAQAEEDTLVFKKQLTEVDSHLNSNFRYAAEIEGSIPRDPAVLRRETYFSSLADTLIRSHVKAINSTSSESDIEKNLAAMKSQFDRIDGKLNQVIKAEQKDWQDLSKKVDFWAQYSDTFLGRKMLAFRLKRLHVKTVKAEGLRCLAVQLKKLGYDFNNALQVTLTHFNVAEVYDSYIGRSRAEKCIADVKEICVGTVRPNITNRSASLFHEATKKPLPAAEKQPQERSPHISLRSADSAEDRKSDCHSYESLEDALRRNSLPTVRTR